MAVGPLGFICCQIGSHKDIGMSKLSCEQARASFPITRQWAFFDHAAVAPLSGPAREALLEYADDLAHHGDVHYGQWVERVEAVRSLSALLLNARAEDVAFVKNTSEGIGLVAEGIRWNAGDNVVIAQEEYPANVYPWLNLADRGVEVRRVPSRGSRVLLDDLAQSIDSRTRIVSLSIVEFASGFRNDLDAIGGLCRERSCRFLVDAIQGLGVFPLDVARTPIDFLAADGHKWLLGPEGAGIFWVRPEALADLRPLGIGWNSVLNATDFSTIDFRLKPHAGRYESGSLNVAGVHALGASIALLLQVGIAEVRDRVLMLTDYLCERLNQLGLTVFSSRLPDERSGIVSVCWEDRQALRALLKHCRARGIVVNERGGRLRISPHFYNTTEELDRLIDALREFGR